ncbi:MAG: hybrid sensor histidine kinase/response regulator [Candidatus Eisenbacteria bacterium]
MESERATRILVVDDNPRNVAILKKILSKSHDVATAGSGEEALAVASGFVPDLILLDIMMPGIDGYETCRRLRARPDLKQTKIIMVSAKAMVSERLEGYEAGADDYVTKPFDEDELVAKIRVYLRLKSVEEVDRLKSELLALLNHETRTPLTFMIAPTEMLLNDPSTSPEQRELLQMVHDGAKRLHRLVERVSFLSSLKTGTCRFDLESCDLSALVEGVVTTMESTASTHLVRFERQIQSGVRLTADPAKLKMVLSGILENAVRFSPEGSAIEVTLSAQDEKAVLSVTDHGPGIEPDFLPRIFEEFAVSNLQNHSSGHGLSLASARLVILRHRGTLVARSEPGQGATFRIELPTTVPATIRA